MDFVLLRDGSNVPQQNQPNVQQNQPPVNNNFVPPPQNPAIQINPDIKLNKFVLRSEKFWFNKGFVGYWN